MQGLTRNPFTHPGSVPHNVLYGIPQPHLPNIPPSRLIYSRTTPLDTTDGERLYPPFAASIIRLRASLTTVGSTDTTGVLKLSSTLVTTVTFAIRANANVGIEARPSGRFIWTPDDALVIALTAVGTGADGLHVVIEYSVYHDSPRR